MQFVIFLRLSIFLGIKFLILSLMMTLYGVSFIQLYAGFGNSYTMFLTNNSLYNYTFNRIAQILS